MMLKVGSEFLEFNETVELERQALLFEELSETRGDFSYSFNIPRTHKNCGILGQPFPDNASKRVYTKIDCHLLSDSGSVLHIGFLMVERLLKREIVCSFFSGNSNWLSQLTGDMTELNLSAYDRDISTAEITASWTELSGIVFPVIDTGVLIDRGYYNLVIEDFVGCFYLHTLFREVMQQSGLKVAGELMNDALYNKIIIATNTRSKVDADNNSISVGKNDMQVIPDAAGNYTITFNLQSGGYFVGPDAAFTTDTTWTAPYDMLVDVMIRFDVTDPRVGRLYLNGVAASEASNREIKAFGLKETVSTIAFRVNAGDTLEFRMNRYSATTGAATVNKATMEITPRFIYRSRGNSSVPLWTKLEFVNNILALFNCVTDYDPYSKTVTINLFDKIKGKPPVDLSPYIDASEMTVDYSEFIANYGKNTILKYQENDTSDELSDYNIGVFLNYGSGVIEVDNELIPESATMLESDFTTPISYLNPVFDASLERVPFVEYEDVFERESDAVTDSSGNARFSATTNFTPFNVGDKVRIESTYTGYNGVWLVSVADPSYLEFDGLLYEEDATGTMTQLRFSLTTEDTVYLMVNVNGIDVEDISNTRTGYYLDGNLETNIGYAFFNLLNTNTQVNEDYKQGLAFGVITDPLFYQRTLIQTYWRTAERVLNDPVKIIPLAYLPESIYNELTPLSPVYIKTEETVNEYYVNRITGFYPCEIELIKLP